MATHREKLLAGRRRATLMRYRLIMEEFEKHNDGERSITTIWRKYIRPKYPCSRQTLYKAFNTDIERELQEVKERGVQLRMF